MNNINITGRIGSNPEVKKTQSGKSVMQINLAVKRDKDVTDWIPVVLWNQSADFIGQYAKKGDLIEVSGRLQSRSYESQGQKRTVLEVIANNTAILSHSDKQQNNSGGNPYPAQNQRQSGYNEPSQPEWGNPIEISSEDLPF